MEGVNLELKAGEILALTGESGSGKSTLGHLFLRLHDPDQGAVLFDGVDAKDLDVAWLREQIGVVGQQTVLFEGTFKENIRYGRLDASDEDIIRAAKEANAHEFIMNNPDGYDSKILIGGKNLSGGQQQRIAIARALVKDPPILLLDEATAALDKAGAEVVHKALLGAMQKRSVLLIAHDDLAVKLANKVVTMCELKHGIAVDPNEDGTQEPY